jgi:hypothetical protein
MKQLEVLKLVANKEKEIFKNMQTPANIYGFMLALHLDSSLDFGVFVERCY